MVVERASRRTCASPRVARDVGVVVGLPVDGGRRDQPVDMVERERLELHVTAGERDRFERLGHPATVANQRPATIGLMAITDASSRLTRSGCARSTSSGCDASGAPSGRLAPTGFAAWIADMDFDVAPGIRRGVARR